MRRLTLMLVATTLLGGSGLFALACSSDPAAIPGDDDDDDDESSSGNGSSGNTSGSTGNTTSGSSGTTSGSSSGGGCFAKLRPSADNGPFCPFLPKSGSSGVGANCATGETCCSGRAMAGGSGFDPSTCSESADDCAPPSDPEQQLEAYECTEKNDCVGGGDEPPAGDAGSDGGSTSSGGGGGQVCCVLPFNDSTIGETSNDFGCNVLTGTNGTRCRSACAANELQGCQADVDCPSGQTCTLASTGAQGRINMGVCK